MNEPASPPSRDPEFDGRAEVDYLLAGLPRHRVSIVTLYQALTRAEVDMIVRVPKHSTQERFQGLVLEDVLYGRLFALFTEANLAARWVERLAPEPHEIVQRLGGEIIAVLGEDVGIWLNPEGRRGCRIAARTLHRLREDFGIHLPTRSGDDDPTPGPDSLMGSVPVGHA